MTSYSNQINGSRPILLCVLTVSLLLAAFACKKNDKEAFDVQFYIPETITLQSDASEMEFKVLFDKAPVLSDVIIFTDGAGNGHECKITGISSGSFSVKLFSGFSSGPYSIYVQRGSDKKLVGKTTLKVISSAGGTSVTPDSGSTVYGIVTCGNEGVKDVLVSDGVEIVKTNDKGIYQLHSAKEYGYVFMIIPGGYEVSVAGVFPSFWQKVSKTDAIPQRVDFELFKADNDNFTLYVMGDMHLAKKQNDIAQFRNYTSDLTSAITASSGKQYGLTLGDMTWDYYWYRNTFGFAEYTSEINQDLGGRICIFHTMGNHDNDYRQVGDFNKELAYRQAIAPTFYSYNLGKIHFVVLDDIDYKNSPASVDNGAGVITADHRSEYDEDFTAAQMDWLKKDLAYVDKSTPVVISAHAPVYRPLSATASKNDLAAHGDGDYGTAEFRAVVKGWNVHFFSGHTHNLYEVDDSANGFYETNGGAVCGTWWWSGYYNPGFNLSQDGTPGGYTICKVVGTKMTWVYKSAGADAAYQFRSYDMNEVKSTLTDNLGNNESGWKDRVAAVNSLPDNSVLLNVWNYDSSWKISVKDGGSELSVTPVMAYDPLHLLVMSVPRYKAGSDTFTTNLWSHFFIVRTSSATSTLSISVTDRFGNVFEETMARPKKLNTTVYRY